jgi:hypothetical protein
MAMFTPGSGSFVSPSSTVPVIRDWPYAVDANSSSKITCPDRIFEFEAIHIRFG